MSAKIAPYGIHWFRRDLRIVGNENLRHNWKINKRRVLGLFCFDSVFLAREDFSHHRFALFLKTLHELKNEMQKQGGDLLVVDALPQTAFQQIFSYLQQNNLPPPSLVSYGRDYEPFARSRDEKMSDLFKSFSVAEHTGRDHLLIEPEEVQKEDGTFYQVYSPYARKWFEKLATPEVQMRVFAQKKIDAYYERLKSGRLEKIFDITWGEFKNFPYRDSLEKFITANQPHVKISIPEAGFAAAYERLLKFKNSVAQYKDMRDFPDRDGTSMMSLYFKNGSIVSSQVIAALELENRNFKSTDKAAHYIKEIAWREFYYSIIYNRPDCEKHSFLPQYENLNWENNQEWFEKWCAGMTGYPIVDAGMRQLNTTGWMHNRVRMIVASFLVKDLLIDWRLGENYFMKMLLDGDLAPNNGGWQWAASTGCDPQPYFRIFNPWLQAAKFDPEAHYIKKYVPELRNLSAKAIHSEEGLAAAAAYPKPIVNHALQKEKALLMFKRAGPIRTEK